tara:strand:+ start:1645 stop:2718 length:1074 start_codon:yes stop_codon:yes gene_type:complete
MSIPGFGSPGVGTPPSTAQQSYQYEAPEIQARKLGLMDIAADLAQGKPAVYGGMQIPEQQQAGFTGAQDQAFNLAQQGIGGYQPFMNNANFYAQKAADPTAYKDFMNPYQDEVISGIEDQFAKAENQQNMQAVQAGAFGGSRQGIAASELAGQRASAVGQAQAQAFGQAQQMAQSTYGNAAQTQAALGAQQQGLAGQDVNTLLQTGGRQQQFAQQGMDSQYRQQLQQMYEPYQRLGFVSDMYQGAPTSASSLTMATTPQANPMSQAIGMGITGLAAYQGFANGNTGTDPSDVRLKEDIELIGKSPAGVNIYSFKYKDKEGKYEGVMAQEVPWASQLNKNGYLEVDYSKIDVEFKKPN